QLKKEKRTLWVGVSFIFSLLGIAGLLSLIMVNYPESVFTQVMLVIAIIFAMILLLFPLLLIGSLLITGMQLIKREGAGVAHVLSIAFGILYILYLVVWPMLENAF